MCGGYFKEKKEFRVEGAKLEPQFSLQALFIKKKQFLNEKHLKWKDKKEMKEGKEGRKEKRERENTKSVTSIQEQDTILGIRFNCVPLAG